jgi:hypothetical protein
MITLIFLLLTCNSFAQLVKPTDSALDTLDQWIHKYKHWSLLLHGVKFVI